MSKIYNYSGFLNEEFYKKLFTKQKRKTESKVDCAVKEIIDFLSDNGINDWNGFINAKPTDRRIIDIIIDNSSSNMSELKEIRFRVKLQLSDNNQLRQWLKELENEEEYEKCAQVLKKLSR